MRSLASTWRLRAGSSSGSAPRSRTSRSSSAASSGGLEAASSRRAMPSAFSATSVRNFIRWSSISGSTSRSRNSATASRSSGAVGRSGMLDQVEQLVLHLRREPPEDGQLDAPLEPVQVAARLGQAADGPLEVADHLPPVEVLRCDVEPGQLTVAREVRLELADAADVPVVGAEPPGADERPGQVVP